MRADIKIIESIDTIKINELYLFTSLLFHLTDKDNSHLIRIYSIMSITSNSISIFFMFYLLKYKSALNIVITLLPFYYPRWSIKGYSLFPFAIAILYSSYSVSSIV